MYAEYLHVPVDSIPSISFRAEVLWWGSPPRRTTNPSQSLGGFRYRLVVAKPRRLFSIARRIRIFSMAKILSQEVSPLKAPLKAALLLSVRKGRASNGICTAFYTHTYIQCASASPPHSAISRPHLGLFLELGIPLEKKS